MGDGQRAHEGSEHQGGDFAAQLSRHRDRAYLESGGTIEHVQRIAAHESPGTTKLYDRTNEQITLDEIERIAI